MAEQDHNTLVHTHVDENGNVITHCHSGEGHTHADQGGHQSPGPRDRPPGVGQAYGRGRTRLR